MTGGVVRELNWLEAAREAVAEEMGRDDRVFVMGQDVRRPTSGFTFGLVEEFGPERVRNTPISEAAVTGMAVGAAMAGRRPVVELHVTGFAYLAMDQLVNQAAKNRFMFGGQVRLPMVVHLASYHNANLGAQHADRPHPMFMNVPGLKVLAPTRPADARALMAAAIRDDDPVIIVSDTTYSAYREEVGDDSVAIGEARVARPGTDVTLVAFFTVFAALEAAERLADRGISVEVIDPRTLAPLDRRTIIQSVRKTGRLVVADVAHRTASAASEVAATVAEHAFDALRAPVALVCTPDVHIPFSPALQRGLIPDPGRIIEAVERIVEGRGKGNSGV